MSHLMHVDGDYIIYIGAGETEITVEEYEDIKNAIEDMPEAEEGCAYRLTTELAWEKVEAPDEAVDDATSSDYESALSELGVKLND